jgi:NAD(P)-dependent dehydrogenase (short-subunit alcohol dehydrogenase family)
MKIVIIGGTQGIGRACVRKCAQIPGASVLFTGRNLTLGNDLSRELSKYNVEFIPFDVTSMSQVEQFTRKIDLKIDALLLFAGGLNYGPRKTTIENLESTFAQNVASRFLLTKNLISKMNKNAKVVNCLGGGMGSNVDPQDFQITKNFSFVKAASQYASMNDYLAIEFGKRYGRDVKFFHMRYL